MEKFRTLLTHLHALSARMVSEPPQTDAEFDADLLAAMQIAPDYALLTPMTWHPCPALLPDCPPLFQDHQPFTSPAEARPATISLPLLNTGLGEAFS
jgi:hypothetical protein